MTIFIARDGDMIGEYPHSQLEAMARAGRLRPEDDYWHEGMEGWATLREFLRPQAWEPVAEEEAELPPPPSGPAIDRRVLIGGGAALLGLILLVGFLVIKPEGGQEKATGVQNTLRPNAPTASEIRDKAAADLKAKVDALPGAATPPLNAFYYDVRIEMNKSLSTGIPWTAVMRGYENTVDPATQDTKIRTEFALTMGYEDGEWTFQHYHAEVGNVSENTATQIDEDGNSAVPPMLVQSLGLKRPSPPVAPPAIVPSAPTPNERTEKNSRRVLPPPLITRTPSRP